MSDLYSWNDGREERDGEYIETRCEERRTVSLRANNNREWRILNDSYPASVRIESRPQSVQTTSLLTRVIRDNSVGFGTQNNKTNCVATEPSASDFFHDAIDLIYLPLTKKEKRT